MNGGYWYLEGDDGVHYCYAKTPTFTCRYQEGIDTEEQLGLQEAAQRVGITKLDEIIRQAHRRTYGGGVQGIRDRDENDKLTDTCRCCGTKLKRHGFAVWAERERDATDSPSDRIGGAFGFTPTENVLPLRYKPTKAKAAQWARGKVAKTKNTTKGAA